MHMEAEREGVHIFGENKAQDKRHVGICNSNSAILFPMFIEQANLHHPTIEFTAETFDTETAFLDTVVYKLRHKIHGKIYPWCTLQTLKKELSKEKPWESFEKNSSETAFEENNSIF